jgi:hypothetical protein
MGASFLVAHQPLRPNNTSKTLVKCSGFGQFFRINGLKNSRPGKHSGIISLRLVRVTPIGIDDFDGAGLQSRHKRLIVNRALVGAEKGGFGLFGGSVGFQPHE